MHVIEREPGRRRTALRVGAGCAIVGPLLALVVNVLHPRPSLSEVGRHETFARLAADSTGWMVIHLGLVLAFVLIFGGLVAVGLTLLDDGGAWIARLALSAAALGSAINVVQASVDTAYGRIAEDWAAAPAAEKATALRVAAAAEDIDFTLIAVEIVVFFGFTFILYGLAILTGERYPRWLGWVALAAGVVAVPVGIEQALTKPSFVTLFVFPALAAIVSLWLVVVGVLLWRST
jgi:hypothetical protein